MPTEPAPLTLSQVVHRAVEVCDPAGTDADLADFFLRFEDADEPVSAIEDIEQRMAEAAGALDPEGLLTLAARAEFNGNPPAPVAQWLQEQGVG